MTERYSKNLRTRSLGGSFQYFKYLINSKIYFKIDVDKKFSSYMLTIPALDKVTKVTINQGSNHNDSPMKDILSWILRWNSNISLDDNTPLNPTFVEKITINEFLSKTIEKLLY